MRYRRALNIPVTALNNSITEEDSASNGMKDGNSVLIYTVTHMIR